MKKMVTVCLAVLVSMSAVIPVSAARSTEEESPFTLARRVGEPRVRYLHMFSTSVGKYTIRHDGMGEVYVGGRKKVFHLKASPTNKIDRLYFYEYGGDLLLLYAAGASGYLVQLDQKTRKIKAAHVVNHDFEPPVIREKTVVFSDGTVVPLS